MSRPQISAPWLNGTLRANAVCVILTAGLGVSGGCRTIQTTDGTEIRRNLPVEKVPGKFGQPDLVRQRRGTGQGEGETRYYFNEQPPAEAWEGKDVETEYFYTGRGSKLIVTEGRVRETASIGEEECAEVLRRVRGRREVTTGRE